jgi:hypothetical protein
MKKETIELAQAMANESEMSMVIVRGPSTCNNYHIISKLRHESFGGSDIVCTIHPSIS